MTTDNTILTTANETILSARVAARATTNDEGYKKRSRDTFCRSQSLPRNLMAESQVGGLEGQPL